MLNNVSAASYMLRGLQLITQPSLRRFVIIPFIINLLIFSGSIWLGGHYFEQLMMWINQHLPSWLHWLQWLLWIVFGLFSLIILFYTFTTLANLIAAPFNALLAEKIEIYLTGTAPPTATTWWDIMKSIPMAFMRQIKLLIYYLLRSIGLWLLLFIPVVHVFAVVAWFFFTAWMASLQYLDYPMDNNQISFAQMRKLLGQKRLSALSFGTMTMLFTMVPVLNFIAMPAAIAGATLFWVEEFKGKL